MKSLLTWLGHQKVWMAVVLVAVLIIPALYGGLLTWSNQDPVRNLDMVPAAIVNDDQAVTSDDGENLSLGVDLVDELMNGESTSFAWQTMDLDDATAELSSGDVLAVLHIPSTFSSNVASLGDADPMKATTAQLTITTNDSANMIIGNVASTISAALNETLGDKVRSEYLSKVYLGFNTLHDQMASASDAAQQLSDGTVSASEGSSALKSGLTTLNDGTASLDKGAQTLSSGAQSLQSGAQNLSAGLATLDSTVASMPDQVGALATGAKSAADGAQALADGASTIASGAAAVSQGTAAALAGAQSIGAGMGNLAAGTQTVADSTSALAAALGQLSANYAAMTDEQRMGAIAQLASNADALSAGAASARDGAVQVQGGVGSLIGDPSQGTGLATLAASTASLAGGTSDLASKAADLASGMGKVSEGTAALNAKIPQLTSAVSSLDSGSSTLAQASASLANGASSLASGANGLADGTKDALAGVTTLDDGLGTLADGTQELTQGLQKGTEEIPDYTPDESDHLSQSAASAVTVTETRENEVPTYGYGLVGYFVAIALWVGAVAFYLVFPSVAKKRVQAGEPMWKVALWSILPGLGASLVQSSLLAWVVIGWLHIHPANLSGFLFFTVMASLVSFGVNHALIALLKLPGRFLSLILLVIQVSSAAGMYPLQTLPAFLQSIHNALPVSYVVGAIRSTVAGGTVSITQSTIALILWLIIAVCGVFYGVILAKKRYEKDPEDNRGKRFATAA